MTTNKHFVLVLMAFALSALGCEKYDAPPEPIIVGLVDGVLPDFNAPVVLDFHEAVKEGSLEVRVVLVEVDEEGDLVEAPTVYFDSKRPEGGSATFNEARTRYTIALDATLPVGPRLAIEIAPGLADDLGNKWEATQLLEFAYGFRCDREAPMPTTFPSAVHFMLANVEKPLAVQLKLMADIRVDAATGTYVGQFTDADRDPATECGLSCAAEEVCRTLPEAECVLPSDQAQTPDEYPDFIHNPPGFSFTIEGCAIDLPDGSWGFATFADESVDVEVSMPEVVVADIRFNASFALDGAGVLRGGGSFTAADILLGPTMAESGAGSGSVALRSIPPDEIKPGLPAPPVE
jgi:hypothetical protein